MTAPKKLYTVAEVAQATGFSPQTIRNVINGSGHVDGWPKLRAKRVADYSLRITPEALDEWISAMPDTTSVSSSRVVW